MKKSPGPIHADDWYKDRTGKTWSVVSIDVERRQVRLRLVDKPERTVSLDILRKTYTLTGLRAIQEKMKDETDRSKKGKTGPAD